MVNDLRNGFGLGFDRNLIHFSRYKIVGSRSEGKYILTKKQQDQKHLVIKQNILLA